MQIRSNDHNRRATAVALWLAEPEALDAAVLAAFERSLSENEFGRWRRFRHAGAALQFLVGRGVLREALSRATEISPADWRFEIDPNGKPTVARARDARDWRFSLSHTSRLVAVAVSEGVDVGVDVEDMRRPLDVGELAPLALSQSERSAIERADAFDRKAIFYRLWTLKEAYSKARGLGLLLPFDQISFDADGDFAILLDPQDENAQGWAFQTMRPTRHHTLAIAARSEEVVLSQEWLGAATF